ncbi:MAG TPA: hypothetical protein VLT33_34650, partial [Labilithrix sp.]|nr:hypothetical protein [Labilithrix sp.]
MAVGVCASCAELFERARVCPRCGSKLATSRAALLAWAETRERLRIDAWHADGVIDEATAARLRSPGGVEDEEDDKDAAPAPPRPSVVERGADGVVTGASELYREMSVRWTRLTLAIEEERAPPDERIGAAASLQRDERTLDAGRAIFARDGSAVVGAGVEALAALDDDDELRAAGAEGAEGEGKPFGALQVFWFIGTVLVLAGSVMGVREAWRTLEGVWRPVVIASAFFAYHVLFLGLARLLVKRSLVTGRVLAGIAAGLLPIVFVAASVAIGQRAGLGIPFAALLLAASVVTLLFAGRITDRAATGLALAFGLAPSLLVELALGTGGASASRRGLFVLAALVPVAIAATRARTSPSRSALVGLAAAAYGAVAVAILGLYGGPGDLALPFEDGGVAPRALVAWLAVAAAIAWWASTGPAVTTRLARYAPVPVILSLAVLVGTSVAALLMGVADGRTSIDPETLAAFQALGLAAHAPLGVLLLTMGVLIAQQRDRAGALHVVPLVGLGGALLAGRTLFPQRPELWAPCCAVVPATYLVIGALVTDRRRRAVLATWGIALGALMLIAVIAAEGAARTPTDDRRPWILSTLTALVLAVAAHVGARLTRPSLHVAGALFAFAGVMAWRLPSADLLPNGASPWCHTVMLAAAGLAAVYGVLALGYATFAPKGDDRRPLDDVSLLFATGGVWLGVLFASRAAPWDAASGGRLALAMPALALAVVLLVRAPRDRSALVVAQGAVGLALAGAIALGIGSPGWQAAPTAATSLAIPACFVGVMAAAFSVPAALRVPRDPALPRFGRALYGLVPLPLSGGPRTLLDGFAIVSAALAALACLFAASWLSALRDELSRSLVLLGLAGVLCTGVAAFATRAFALVRARGAVATLWVVAPIIGLTAVAYRIGRPLAPDVVGFRLSIVIALVWLLARGIVRVGPRLGRALDRPEDGPRYHHVAHAGVLALTLLLFVDAVLVGGPTPTRSLAVVPPLLLAGSALGSVLLYRSYGREPFWHFGMLLAAGASVLGFAQRAVLGPALVPLDPPGGRWVPAATALAASESWLDPARFLAPGDSELAIAARAWLGLAAAAIAMGALLAGITRAPGFARIVRETILGRAEVEAVEVERGLAVPIAILAGVLALGLAWQPSLPAAAAYLAAGALAAAARSPSYRSVPLILAGPVLVHALAESGPTIPWWPGPALAALALGSVMVGRRVSSARGGDPTALAKTQTVALAYAPLAVAYALAAGGVTSPDGALPRVLDQAALSLDGRWVVSYAPALTFALLAVATAAAGLSWRSGLAKLVMIVPALLLGLAGAAFTAAFTSVTGRDALVVLVSREGALLAALLAGSAATAHVSAVLAARAQREEATWGLSIGRDVVLVASGLVMCLFVAARLEGGYQVGLSGIAALGLALVVSVHAIAWQGTARHVAIVEALVVAFYAFATRSFRPGPEIDALIGLLYGFSLLGVAVIARRRKITAVASATRRFAAALPIALFLLTTSGATNQAAGLALGASFLYGAMAYAERSRIFGSLAALAANLALVVFAVAQGLDGAEVFVGPLGIFVTALAQIFAPKMAPPARTALRIIGGALLYLPAGLKLTFRLGAAEDGTYSVVFGVVCILGVLAGLVLHVRAYLALGTLFLTLDVIANLVHAGLRDHRVG